MCCAQPPAEIMRAVQMVPAQSWAEGSLYRSMEVDLQRQPQTDWRGWDIVFNFQQQQKKKNKVKGRAPQLGGVEHLERSAWLKPQLIKTTRCVNSEATRVDAQCIMNLTLHSHHSEPSQAAGHADLRIPLHLLTTSIDLMDPNGLTWRGMASQPCNVYHLEVCCFYHLAEFMPLRWLKISK